VDTVALAAARIPALTCSERMKLLDALPDTGRFADFRRIDLESIIGRIYRSREFKPEEWLRQAENDKFFLTERGFRFIFYGDADYPGLLREIYDPPFALYVAGKMRSGPCVAVVGTRKPSPKALRAAWLLGNESRQYGVTVVSGLALGIDGRVLRGCVDAQTGSVAVLPAGLDEIYPVCHRPLAADILTAGGALVTEYPPGTPVRAFRFVARNRIISGLSHRVIVVEAPAKSGALLTSDFALDQGRDVCVHADGLDGFSGAGTCELAVNGARVITTLGDMGAAWMD